jgi:formylglycine-generating enzyme
VELSWVFVPAGICLFGDRGRPVDVAGLWWTRTTVIRRQAGLGGEGDLGGDLPVTGITQDEAVEIAYVLGGRLPRSVEWEWMAAGPARRCYPWGDQPWEPSRANLRASGHLEPLPVGSFPAGATPEGLFDVAGNVWEWTSSLVLGDGAVLRGGSYNSLPPYARCQFLNAAPRWLRSSGIGVRVVRDA